MEVPKYLYKYRCWDDQYHRRIITNGEIYFTSANKFNDPFDCNIPLRYDKQSDEENLKIIKINIQEQNPEMTQLNIAKKAKNQLDKRLFEDEENIKSVLEDIRKTVGIFSTADSNKNLLMWSHYANSHFGFCVEFEYERLIELFNKLAEERNIVIEDAYKVSYEEKYPCFIPNELNNEDFFVKPLSTKSNVWVYEDEYRILSSDLVNSSLRLDNGIITRIFLGCNMISLHKEEIISELSKWPNKIELLQAKMKKDQFGLDFEEISY